MSFDLTSYLDTRADQVNDALMRIFDSGSAPAVPTRIQEAMTYSLMAGGKRIRPILCIAAAEALGLPPTPHILTAACAIEVLHTYSLIHDDLPAMDNDRLRRGKPTNHIAFDETTAILAGDALLTLAFELLSAIPAKGHKEGKALLDIIHTLSRAAGYKGIIEGQMQDLAAEDIRLSLEELEAMHALKTGALIGASVYAGAVLGEGSITQIEQLGRYARHIGLAFQVADDILNVEGDTAVMGKVAGTDKHRGKSTYPSLLGMDESKAFEKKLVNNALKALADFDRRADPLRSIAVFIIERRK
ncbi:MAG: farnesyl diphosphate synthase [Desulfobacterales bacterium]